MKRRKPLLSFDKKFIGECKHSNSRIITIITLASLEDFPMVIGSRTRIVIGFIFVYKYLFMLIREMTCMINFSHFMYCMIMHN